MSKPKNIENFMKKDQKKLVVNPTTESELAAFFDSVPNPKFGTDPNEPRYLEKPLRPGETAMDQAGQEYTVPGPENLKIGDRIVERSTGQIQEVQEDGSLGPLSTTKTPPQQQGIDVGDDLPEHLRGQDEQTLRQEAENENRWLRGILRDQANEIEAARSQDPKEELRTIARRETATAQLEQEMLRLSSVYGNVVGNMIRNYAVGLINDAISKDPSLRSALSEPKYQLQFLKKAEQQVYMQHETEREQIRNEERHRLMNEARHLNMKPGSAAGHVAGGMHHQGGAGKIIKERIERNKPKGPSRPHQLSISDGEKLDRESVDNPELIIQAMKDLRSGIEGPQVRDDSPFMTSLDGKIDGSLIPDLIDGKLYGEE